MDVDQVKKAVSMCQTFSWSRCVSESGESEEMTDVCLERLRICSSLNLVACQIRKIEERQNVISVRAAPDPTLSASQGRA